jgi:hypothetical protein
MMQAPLLSYGLPSPGFTLPRAPAVLEMDEWIELQLGAKSGPPED